MNMKKILTKITFKKIVLLYCFILTILLFIFNFYVNSALLKYEKNDEYNYILFVVEDIVQNGVKSYIEEDIGNVENYVIELLTDDTLTINLVENSDNTYEVSSKNVKILTIKLGQGESVNLFGLLNYKEIYIIDIEMNMDF